MSKKYGEMIKSPEEEQVVAPTRLAEIEVFIDADFQPSGTGWRTNVGWNLVQDGGWNDEISSLVVISGRWKICTDTYLGGHCVILGPGRYRNEHEIGLPNDSISSFVPISDD